MDTWILRNCRRVAKNRLIACGLVLAAGLFVVASSWRYVVNFVRGPFPATEGELSGITDADAADHYFVAVATTDIRDTGVYEETTQTNHGVETSHYISARFYAIPLGKRFLIVRSHSQPQATVIGELKPLSAELRGYLLPDDPAEAASVLLFPFYLDSEGFRTVGYWGLAIGLVLLGILAYYGFIAWRRFQEPMQTPVATRAQEWGDPITVSHQMEEEFRHAVRFRKGGTRLSDNYVITKSLFVFDAHRFHDLLWAYKKVVKQRVNFVPVGKNYFAILHFYGGKANIRAKEKQVTEMLAFAAQRAPWAAHGYSKELEKLFSKDKTAFCAAVEQRRHELASASPHKTEA